MITLVEEITGRQVVLKKGDKISYRKSDGLIRFSNVKGARLSFGGNGCDDGILYSPNLSFEEVRLLAKVVARLAGVGVGKEIHDQKMEDYFVIEFI